jgi:hypothetical protein
VTPGKAWSVDTESYGLGDRFNHWFNELVTLCESRKFLIHLYEYRIIGLLDVPKESLYLARSEVDESYFYGTNFRHTVEFSRSGRTPSRPLQADPGQPEIHYPVGLAGSNPAPPASRLVEPVVVVTHRTVALGGSSRSPRGLPGDPPWRLSDPARSGVRRTGRTLVSADVESQIAYPGACRPVFPGILPARQARSEAVWPG